MRSTTIEYYIYVLYNPLFTNKLMEGNYLFSIFSLTIILITSFCAQDKNLIPGYIAKLPPKILKRRAGSC